MDDLHVGDHAVLLDLGLARLLRGVGDADALTALGGAASGCRLQLPLQADHLARQFLVCSAGIL